MVAAEATDAQPPPPPAHSVEGEERVPLAPAEKSSNVARRPRNREVSSRYKTALQAAPPPPPSRRFPSPNLGRSSDAAEPPKRAISAERQRSSEGIWSSSAQPQTPPALSSIQANGIDHSLRQNGGLQPRRGTPERKRNPIWRHSADQQTENARPFENLVSKPEFQKWPGSKSISKSVDLSTDRRPSSNKVSRQLSHGRSFNQLPSLSGIQKQEEGICKVDKPVCAANDTNCVRRLLDEATDLGRCDSFSETCGSENNLEEVETSSDRSHDQPPSGPESSHPPVQPEVSVPQPPGHVLHQPGTTRPSRSMRGTDVPARFWQDLGGRIRRLSDVNHLRSSLPEGEMSNSTRTSRKPKGAPLVPPSVVSTAVNPPAPWNFPSVRNLPATVAQQPVSPSAPTKVSSPSRVLPSPTRGRAGIFPNGVQRPGSVACMLNFGVDSYNSSKGRKALSQQEEAHYFRVLHNRWLQWRFVNARAQAAMESQKATAEGVLFNASKQISDLRDRVKEKRIKVQQAKQEEKVHSIITSHERRLEEWAQVEGEHSSALSGTIQALQAGTLRVPITGGAKLDILALKQAFGSAADAIASLESSAETLMPKAEKTSGLVSELAEVAAQERAVLQECGELLDRIAALEIEDRSLRCYVVQLEKGFL